jgi:hypothetical protein
LPKRSGSGAKGKTRSLNRDFNKIKKINRIKKASPAKPNAQEKRKFFDMMVYTKKRGNIFAVFVLLYTFAAIKKMN